MMEVTVASETSPARTRLSSSELAALAGRSIDDLLEAGLTPLELKAEGVSAAQLKERGKTAGQLRSGYSALQLREAGYTAIELKLGGFAPNKIKRAGFTEADVRAAVLVPRLKYARPEYARVPPSQTFTKPQPQHVLKPQMV